MTKRNIYDHADFGSNLEVFELLAKGEGKFKVEKIISRQYSNGEWYDQPEDEFVLLLEGLATIEFENGDIVELQKGDFIKIEKHNRHRVLKTSENPQCVWLTLFANNISLGEMK